MNTKQITMGKIISIEEKKPIYKSKTIINIPHHISKVIAKMYSETMNKIFHKYKQDMLLKFNIFFLHFFKYFYSTFQILYPYYLL